MPANIGDMFYYGDVPWHGEGYKVSKPLTVDEALQAGRLDWEVEMIPLQTAEQPASPVLNRLAVARCDRKAGHPGRVVGVAFDGFRPLQNRDGAKIFDAIFGKGKPVYHTGGYLKNGEVVWLLAALDKHMQILNDDIVAPYALFTNSHDGSIAIDFRLTTVRVVCQNTLSLALQQGKINTFFKHSHAGDYDTLKDIAEQFFAGTLATINDLENTFKLMVERYLSSTETQEFVFKVFPDPKEPSGVQNTSRVYKAYLTNLKNVRDARKMILDLMKTGKGTSIKGVQGTTWGAFNAVLEYIDHHHWLGDNYLIAGLFGSKAQLKRKAFELAMSYLPEKRDAA